MGKGKILFIDTVHPVLQARLADAGYECIDGYDLSVEDILRDQKDCTGIVIRSRFRLDNTFLKSMPRLKFIARAGAGMENIDVSCALSLGINCVNAPEGNRNAVAEHALGMLLVLTNKLLKADREVRGGIWLREENRGMELEGKTVGIVGFGNTGKAFAKKLMGFDVKILVRDPYISEDEILKYGGTLSTEEEFFNNCEIVSLHIPLTEETTYLANKKFFSNFKKPFILINTSRGKVLNTSDLVTAMKSGKIKSAALDVLEYEHISFEGISQDNIPESFQYLIKSENVILSPHIAGWTDESHYKISNILADKILQL
jgi:D-3-phosphoglycerate dehydrogenase